MATPVYSCPNCGHKETDYAELEIYRLTDLLVRARNIFNEMDLTNSPHVAMLRDRLQKDPILKGLH